MVLSKRVEDSIILSIYNTKKINFLKINALKNQIVNSLKSSCKKIFIDLEGIHFIDSQSFDCLRFANDLALLNDSELYFINVSEDLKELFSLIDKDSIQFVQ